MAVVPPLLEIKKNRLCAIANQMTQTVTRSAYSTVIKERKDVSSSLFDPQRRLLAEGADVPIHLSMLKPCLQMVFSSYIDVDTLKPGDVVVTNDPYLGPCGESVGSHHTNDIVTIYPIFVKAVLVGFAAVVAHHRDVGASWSGGHGWNREIWQEGFRCPPVKLYEAGERNDACMDLILNNTRVPYAMEGDLAAQIAGCRYGADEVVHMFERYGQKDMFKAFDELISYSESRTRSEIRRIPPGQYTHEEAVLDDGAYGGPYALRVCVHVSDSEIVVDYSGTDRQIEGPINAPWAATYSATHYAIRCITDPTIPNNDGCAKPVEIDAPMGSLVNCQKPAACHQRMIVCHTIVDLIMGALADVIPERVMADSCGCIYCYADAVNTLTHLRGGEVGSGRHTWGEAVPGGLGARSDADGMSVMACHVTNVPIPSIETAETEAPVLYLRREFNPGSAGPGKFRGGFGQVLAWQTLGEGSSTRFYRAAQKHAIPPQGLFGGKNGRPGCWTVDEHRTSEEVLATSIGDMKPLENGSTVTLYTVGGGGFGNPLDRQPDLVRNDVLCELITLAEARCEYGVVLDTTTMKVDVAKTKALRRRRQRGS